MEKIPIIIEKKKIKNIYLKIIPPDGQVKVTAPYFVSDVEIQRFINKKMDWIRQKREKFLESKKTSDIRYLCGESVVIFGETKNLNVIEIHNKVSTKALIDMIETDKNNVTLYVEAGKGQDDEEGFVYRNKLMIAWYRKILDEKIICLKDNCAKIVGKAPDEWKIKAMKTRWGTCNINAKRIWINLWLVRKPVECLEYVMIHELVHFYERGHNGRFYGFMDRFYPDWKNVRKKLNETN